MEAALNSSLGRSVLGPGPFRIGRAPDNTLVITDPQSSSHHAEVGPAYGGNSYQITDLNSTNGTFVNEQRLSPNFPRPLNAGDVIRIGDTTFAYEVSSGYTPTVAASSSNYDPTVAASSSSYPPNVVASSPNYEPTVPASSPNQFAQQQPPFTPPAPAYPPPPYQQPQPSYPQPAYPQSGIPGQPGYPQPAYPQSGIPGQPGYPQPGFSGQPGYPRSKKFRTGLIIAIVAVVLLLGSVGVYAFLQGRPSPQHTLQTFCDDLKSSNYNDIYNLLSVRARGRSTQTEFADFFRLAVDSSGGVKSCTVSNVAQDTSAAAHGNISASYGNGKTEALAAQLVFENNDWKIDKL